MQQEPVMRTQRKSTKRWMPGERWRKAAEAARIVGMAGTCFLLSFADMMGVPSGLHASWIVALAAAGEDVLWSVCGAAMALPMRLLWGLPPRWETLVALLILLPSGRMVHGKRPWRISAWTALSLLPYLLASAGGTTEGMILALGTMLTGVLAAPVICRSLRLMQGGGSITSLEERVAVAYTGALILCGGARLALFGINLGVTGAAILTLCAAAYLGAAINVNG